MSSEYIFDIDQPNENVYRHLLDGTDDPVDPGESDNFENVSADAMAVSGSNLYTLNGNTVTIYNQDTGNEVGSYNLNGLTAC